MSTSHLPGSGGVLCLTMRPHNAHFNPSPTRSYPHRGLSTETTSQILTNEDFFLRLLLEFTSIADVNTLRGTNKTIKQVIDDHSELWRSVQFSPPGLSRLSRAESALAGEKFLRKSAEEGNVEAAMMLALMYHHGYRCPCHPSLLPGDCG